jgi:Zinc knuckle
MDVDHIVINTLTAKEKADCMKKGLCFFCKRAGHMMKNCPKKKSNQNQQGKPKDQQKPPTNVWATVLEQNKEDDEEIKDEDTRETLLRGVKNLSEEDREAFFNELLKKVGF